MAKPKGTECAACSGSSAIIAPKRSARRWSDCPSGRDHCGIVEKRGCFAHRPLSPTTYAPASRCGGGRYVELNGEIYNHAAAGNWGRMGNPSDTEVLLRAYETRGIECPEHLEGCSPSPCSMGINSTSPATVAKPPSPSGEGLFSLRDWRLKPFSLRSGSIPKPCIRTFLSWPPFLPIRFTMA